MLLVQLGHLTVNLEYLIIAEDSKGEPSPKVLPLGTLRIAIEGGRVLDVTGDDADRLRSILLELVDPHFATAPATTHGRVVSRKSRKD